MMSKKIGFDGKNYFCKLCGKTFPSMASARGHLAVCEVNNIGGAGGGADLMKEVEEIKRMLNNEVVHLRTANRELLQERERENRVEKILFWSLCGIALFAFGYLVGRLARCSCELEGVSERVGKTAMNVVGKATERAALRAVDKLLK